ncbi:GNAT family N-acetyltransferase [Desulfomonile tiedjei]|uniref:Sortase-like acyltransferase n=1 Tax=Desulfomonile tiedjei (strain ATCC 49306 / DSM 6799 / DCB-1) TaxID=706587 RepID=I4CC42_DESTA|nr:GNAT family N-acetyltransferase [Desulfomonile tiedjei]AFM27133.1 sortase-like acyltransferase [Desulfomonile tiedjei DSM 6799]
MKMNLSALTTQYREEIVDIFNYYIENSFAAYPEQAVPYSFFDHLLETCRGYPAVAVLDSEGHAVGFGMLRPYNPLPTFSGTAEITYFLKPDTTRKGIGKALLEHLLAEGKNKNLRTVLASVSSLNEASIRFHLKNGFTEAGRFRNVVEKKGRIFDVVYFQRML